MKIIDLTHTITESMPVYPGTEPPTLAPANTYEKDHFRETLLTMFSHTGTHMDAPAHIVPGKTTLDGFPAAQFAGKALAIDCRHMGAGERVPLSAILQYGAKAEEADFLLFNFGWDRFWGKPEYFGDYPCLDEDVVQYLMDHPKKGVGMDTISIDPMASLVTHRRLFENREMVVIENLTNLDQLGDELFWFFALPLKFENADGSPIRAVAFWPE